MNRTITSLAAMAIVCLTLSINPACSQGQHFFDYVQDGTGDVLATLELNSLPANSLAHVEGLSFSAAGDSIYGFGVGEYSGTPDKFTAGLAVDVDANDLLVATSLNNVGARLDLFFDSNGAPPSTVAPFLILRLSYLDSIRTGEPGVSLLATGRNGAASTAGVLRSVPEPSSLMMATIAFSTMVFRRKRKVC